MSLRTENRPVWSECRQRQGVIRDIRKMVRNETMQGLGGPGQEFRLYSEHEGKPFQDGKPASQVYVCPKSTWSLKAGTQAVVSTQHPFLVQCVPHRSSSGTIQWVDGWMDGWHMGLDLGLTRWEDLNAERREGDKLLPSKLYNNPRNFSHILYYEPVFLMSGFSLK